MSQSYITALDSYLAAQNKSNRSLEELSISLDSLSQEELSARVETAMGHLDEAARLREPFLAKLCEVLTPFLSH